MNTLQNILNDYYEQILYTMHPRDAVMENIDKMLNCGDPASGGALYGGPNCGHFKFISFRCKSRFCTTCGNMYSIHRTTAMSFKMLRCLHRHCVFTIPQQLRHFFLEDRDLLNCLFTSVRRVLLTMFRRLSKSEDFTPGFICVLHTFGRNLKWNPHIHVLITEGAAGDFTPWRILRYFNYTFLRRAFCTSLLNEMHSRIGASFKKTRSMIYRICNKEFYVYAEQKKCDPQKAVKYIGRYLGRPVIATSRIDSYDGGHVTFHYHRHEDGCLVTETIPAPEFIQRLIQHIPEKHFKMIRYYGIYARNRVQDKKLYRSIPKEKHHILLSFNSWRLSILHSFGYDPLKCPCCGTTMLFQELYHKHKRVPLEELYQKVMAESGCRSPSLT